jgi:hypothetical protein
MLAAGCDSPPAAIRVPIAGENRSALTHSFTVPVTAVYAVGLEFTKPTSDPEVDRWVDLVASKVGFPNPPPIDLHWRVLEGELTIGDGPGPDGATGIVVTGDGMNAGVQSSTGTEALLFGTFDACAGRTYTIRFAAGPSLARVLSASPAMVIDVHHTLENDGRVHNDGPRLKQVCVSRTKIAMNGPK